MSKKIPLHIMVKINSRIVQQSYSYDPWERKLNLRNSSVHLVPIWLQSENERPPIIITLILMSKNVVVLVGKQLWICRVKLTNFSIKHGKFLAGPDLAGFLCSSMHFLNTSVRSSANCQTPSFAKMQYSPSNILTVLKLSLSIDLLLGYLIACPYMSLS